MASSLAHVFLTLGAVPLIRSANTPLCTSFSRTLSLLLSSPSFLTQLNKINAINATNAINSNTRTATAAWHSSRERPLLVILDRSSDCATPLRHGWAYLDLTNDLLSYAPGRISWNEEKTQTDTQKDTEKETQKEKTTRTRAMSVSLSSDFFWAANIAQPFDQVVTNASALAPMYQRESESLKSSFGLSSADSADSEGKAKTNLMQNLNPLTVCVGEKEKENNG